MNEPKFTVGYGKSKGSKQITFYYASRVDFAELVEVIAREFPEISHIQS